MEENILQVKNLSVTLDSEEILRDISFSVKKGEALAIIGPNGAGKTVLFRALLGLLPYRGEIIWQKGVNPALDSEALNPAARTNTDITVTPRQDRGAFKGGVKIGYVPQKFLPDKSVPITVKEFFLLKSSRFWFPKNEFIEHLSHELNLVGVRADILAKPLSELSGGQFQRILISWAMLDHPDVLLFDEPTAGIDIGAEETIYNLMHRLQDERGTTIILISHDLNVVYRYAQNVLCVNKSMICHGPPNEVLSPQELAKIYGAGGFYHHIESRQLN